MITTNNIKPTGWLKNYLNNQLTGLTGNMAASGFPFDRTFWGNDNPDYGDYRGIFWWPYEQTAYHIDGLVRVGILLDNKEYLKKASDIIYSVINNPDKDGYLGPKGCKEFSDEYTRWPHVVFFRACIALYNYNKDINIIKAIEKHYLNIPFDYSELRNVLNVEIMLDVYAVTKNKKLLKLATSSFDSQAKKAKAQYYSDDERLSDTERNSTIGPCTVANTRKLEVHGVSYNEYAKLGALLYKYTNKKKYLNITIKAYEKIKKHYMLPGGVNSSTERMRSNKYNECAETCDVADMTWSLANLLEITDNTEYADMIEQCIFNAGIGCVTEDFKALQYFSCANQLVLDNQSSHSMFNRGNRAMSYSPAPMTQCCPGNLNRIMPNYVLNMWDTKSDAVIAKMFGPSTYEGEINGCHFEIEAKTSYPFDLNVSFVIKTEGNFNLKVRIPSWCKTDINSDKNYNKDNNYIVFAINGSTQIDLEFPCEIEKITSAPGVYYKRGPIVYCVGMKGLRKIDSNTIVNDINFPSYSIVPDKKWNYAFVKDCIPKFVPGKDEVWDVDYDIPHLVVNAKEISNFKIRTTRSWVKQNWKYETIKCTDPHVFTPNLPKITGNNICDVEEKIVLYPYGASKVRMTVLPEIN